MQSAATTVSEYIAGLPEDRQKVVEAVRKVVRKNLPKGITEQMQYGMIGWVVPHKVYPAGYHCKPSDPVPFAALASQKNHLSLYLLTAYEDDGTAQWLKDEFAARGKKLDMGKSCVRFKKLEDLPLDVIGQVVARIPVDEFLRRYEAAIPKK